MSEQHSGTGQAVYFAGLAAVIIVIIGALWLLFNDKGTTEEPLVLPLPVDMPVVAPEPVFIEPEVEAVALPAVPIEVEETAPEPAKLIEPEIAAPPLPPLPKLNDSDIEVAKDLLALNWRAGLAGLFNREEMLRHFVVTVDNLAQGQLVAGQPVLKAPASGYQVEKLSEDRFRASPSNAQRYEPYIQLLESVPEQHMIALKKRYQPLLEEAFSELGYPDITFDQRLEQAIAVLLATPEMSEGAELTQPSVMYIYADADLEALPEAQKQLLRLSTAQQQRLKALLKRYQQALQR